MSDAPKVTSTATWTKAMAFTTELDGFEMPIDADEKFGGLGGGPKPKGLMLTALAGCTGMDVIAILDKMKIAPRLTSFRVDVSATLTEVHPKVFDRIELAYRFEGADLPPARLQRAVVLSQEKYCGVSAMLRPVAQLARAIYINGELHCTKEDPAPVVKPS